jgi:membrane protease YdiL (CAAX protease family)
MNALRRLIAGHPLTVFVILAYALSWWSIPFANGGILPQGPFFAALILLALTRGRAGVGELFRRMVSWRGGWIWLVIGPGLVVAYLLLALVLNLLLGAAIADTSHLGSLGTTIVILLLLGGVWEEPGWTGYALPMLQERYAARPNGLLLASLHLGLIRAAWHLPLMLSGAIPWYDVLFFSIAFQFLITWLSNRTGGSILIPMLFHLTSNVVGGGIFIPLFAGSEHTRFYVLFIAAAWLLALALVRRDNWSMGREPAAA